MLHYKVETKQEAVRLVLEEHLTYAAVAARLEIRKAERIEVWVRKYREEGEASFHKPIGRPLKAQAGERELERLRMENALLKKFHTELRGLRLAQRNIGRSTTTRENTK
jgi:transposase-like protein